MSDPREERLPKWAREELELLRMRLSEAQDRIKFMSGDVTENVCGLAGWLGEKPQRAVALGREEITFSIGGPFKWNSDTGKFENRRTVSVGVDGDGLVSLRTSGGRMVIAPTVSNSIRVTVRDYTEDL